MSDEVPYGRAPAFVAALEEARLAARSARPALLLGPTGSGKSLLARHVHALGPRRHRKLVVVACPTLAEGIADRELFGAVRGAYTGADRTTDGLVAEADGGTLYLEEVGDLPASVQARLLVFLESGRYRRLGDPAERRADVRVLAATHRDLGADPTFRPDLYHRLAAFPIHLPGLAERAGDLPGLAALLLARLAAQDGLRPLPLSDEAVAALLAHDWPGNVRELENRLGRALHRAHRRRVGALGAEDLDLDGPRAGPGQTLAERVTAFEDWVVQRALDDHRGNVSATARRLGLSRARLYDRIRRGGQSRGRRATGRA